MINNRIEKAIEIIDYAIQNKISVKEASVKCGFSNTYVKNVKSTVYEKYHEKGTLNQQMFEIFNNKHKEYIKMLTNKSNDIPSVNKKGEEPKDIPPTNKNEVLNYNEEGNIATIEWKNGSNYSANHVKTLPELLKICEVDLNIWDVAQQWINKWDVTAVINKEARTFQNFQVKARLEKKVGVVKEKSMGELFVEMTETYKPPLFETFLKTRAENEENNLLEISIFDLHLGKLAWGGETFENYDTKIARSRFLEAIEGLLKRASGFNYSRILFPVGNDFFNSDTIFNTTTKGTQQDEDLRWQKTFNVGVKLLVDAINLLKQTNVPVDVVVIPGNHDFERSFYMGKFLEAWFNGDCNVCVNNGASPRKYYRWYNVLLGLTHGSEEKESSLPMLMATDIESKPVWSDTKFHEWHVGHIHRKRNVNFSVVDDRTRTLNEELGVTIRYLSSLTGTEEWHHKKGFVGASKAADAFIWNDITGLIAHLNTNLIIKSE